MERFVNQIRCGGGGGEEAVEHALAEVRREHAHQPVTRVLLLGDAPPHQEKRGQIVEGRVLQTDYINEAQELAKAGVPVFTFHIHTQNIRGLVETFTYIAETTKGATAELDSPSKLIDVVCESALDDIGGSELVAEYKARYLE
eukprot:8536858-Pyramimonas_sp.AAC.2